MAVGIAAIGDPDIPDVLIIQDAYGAHISRCGCASSALSRVAESPDRMVCLFRVIRLLTRGVDMTTTEIDRARSDVIAATKRTRIDTQVSLYASIATIHRRNQAERVAEPG